MLKDPVAAQTAESVGSWRLGGAYGHSWFVDPIEQLTVVAFTNMVRTTLLYAILLAGGLLYLFSGVDEVRPVGADHRIAVSEGGRTMKALAWGILLSGQ